MSLSILVSTLFSVVEEYGRWNQEKNTWSGAIAELYGGRADISLSTFSISNVRLNAVDFLLLIFYYDNLQLIKKLLLL